MTSDSVGTCLGNRMHLGVRHCSSFAVVAGTWATISLCRCITIGSPGMTIATLRPPGSWMLAVVALVGR